ncbi:ATP-binding cassette domain-containing protein [Natronorubrum sp. JWXQ-INN-674]|uniref:Nickel import system ATP-binding protein NikD n=1 Tax=Natronorubrum halalkaliphilum TaxID=2691917 RepID=A0A6B0VGB5_9EURY|nr:ABC transporter ATP-binding protein [Natronorubrum halalkaliphilum]MXV60530.1 ATP-binding cassette domain-containing protein [Natronorubrum halalkaliphilum]
MTQDPLLSVQNVTTQFVTEEGIVRAVDDLSFDVHRGETLGLVGESGAGKSVAIRSIMRLISSPGEIVSGTITYKGHVILDRSQGPDGEVRDGEAMLSEAEMRSKIRGREIALIFQDPMESLNPVFTIGSQLREFIEINRDLSNAEAKAEAIELLREVGIPEAESRYHEYPHQFSGGMRQRVLIAMALACKPDLIIADEPTTALDVTVEGQILDLIEQLKTEYETSFIWVTHDMGVVAEICDRVNVMYLGELIEQAPVDELFHETKHPYTEALLRSIPKPHETTGEFDPIRGIMPDGMNAPSGCRFHPRCPDAREVCMSVHPDLREIDDGQNAACLKYDVFDADYDDSPPLVVDENGERVPAETVESVGGDD